LRRRGSSSATSLRYLLRSRITPEDEFAVACGRYDVDGAIAIRVRGDNIRPRSRRLWS